MLALAVLLCGLLLTGCAPGPVVLEPRPPVPAALLACRDQPQPPAVVPNDAALGDFMVDLADAGADCRSKLNAVRGIVAR